MKQLKFIGSAFAVAVAMTLTACGGGGGDDGGGNVGNNPQPPVVTVPTTLTDAQIIANLKATNTNYDVGPNGVPVSNGRPIGTWRWANTPNQHIFVYIPTPANTVEQDLANKVQVAINTINSKVGAYLILEPVSVLPTTGHVIQIGYNNAWVPPGSTDYNSYCANVSNAVGFSSTIVPDAQNNIPNPVYMNLGNNRCNVTQDIVTHEFGHALGFATHFDVFGSNKNPDNFWDVLATLYGNPQSTTAENLVVKRAAK